MAELLESCTMAMKPNYAFEKRQREMEKKKKKAEKLQKKQHGAPEGAPKAD